MDPGFISSPSESNVQNFFSSFYQTYDFGLSKQEEVDDALMNDQHFNGSLSSSVSGDSTQVPLCIGCGNPIRDQYILRVAPNLEWHAGCLKCAECGQSLDENCTCYLKNGKTYCKKDYTRLFGAKCSKCGLCLTKNDFIMRAKEKIYHTNCFKCITCDRQLIPGDEFVLRENSVMCRVHLDVFTSSNVMGGNPDCHNIPGFSSPTGSASVVLSPTSINGIRNHCGMTGSNHRSGSGSGSGQKRKDSKTTRVRTVLNEKQLHTLRSCYAANCRPDALMKEQLTEMTGLSARVIRVWFQNKRCKDKKRSLALKQMQEQQAKQQNNSEQNGSGSQGMNGVPMIASEPVKNDPPNPKPVEVRNYQQSAWKALSDFALQSEIEQPGFQHLMNNFSDHGQGSISDSSEICSIPSVSSAGIEVNTACSTPLTMVPSEPNSASACS